ncbi:MAG: transcription-repair coupling factor [Pseudomonadales bacterium]|nr:transcription-repair coupling factor [Pseudomonadales bacterium]
MNLYSPLSPPASKETGQRTAWNGLQGSARALAIARYADQYPGLILVVTADSAESFQLESEISFYLRDENLQVLIFPDWETLVYDPFSPHPDIVSERLNTLSILPSLSRGILIVPVRTLMQRLSPQTFLGAHSLILNESQEFDLQAFRLTFERSGYRHVETVTERGEYASRGSLIDIYPMGAESAYRVDLFDTEIDSLRTFDPETQRTIEKVSEIRLLPAHEFPFNPEAISTFRTRWHDYFDVDHRQCPVYQDVSSGFVPAGIEYYLPLFFDSLSTLFDYLPTQTTIVLTETIQDSAQHFWADLESRYDSLRHDIERPILQPSEMFLRLEELFAALKAYPQIRLNGDQHRLTFDSECLPEVAANVRLKDSYQALQEFVMSRDRRILFTAESAGRRELVEALLKTAGLSPTRCASFQSFEDQGWDTGITISDIETPLLTPDLAVITESQLLGRSPETPRGKKSPAAIDADQIIRNLAELSIGAAVVHIQHGVGRYHGLQTLDIDGTPSEFLTLHYANDAKLYVPVTSLELISRYSGADDSHAPLHKLGSDQWEKAKRKAAEKIHDVAAELLNIYARREARTGISMRAEENDYQQFAESFTFELTQDQSDAIQCVIKDMASAQSMDRLICGDVGFGKTEVAMRAAFIAVQAGKQVAILVPTTLLAQQHLDTFVDRFADWPISIELVSRLRSEAEIEATRLKLNSGNVDIIIGTHRLLNKAFTFKEIGLVIVDEEHRFGVRQKERLKNLRAEVDLLTLTATPIPRTLNMAVGGIRDLSIIATPPAKRLSIKTFVTRWNKQIIREAIARELMRGGQVFYVHNEVRSIDRCAQEIQELLPDVRIGIGHAQMPTKQLERVMSDFHHRRVNVLLCSTIIENGIDISNANTIIIERADKFGLAQLHQLRGRVGRSHRQAYAYLMTPHPKAMTTHAKKRLEAIEAAGELGVGFALATQDMEIRGAGELLGGEQSGQIESIGFSLYMQMLERAVAAIKAGVTPNLDQSLEPTHEINLHIAALIPEDYLPDVHTRLIMYKRIANAADPDELDELRAEMIDRFGACPPALNNMFRITQLKLRIAPMGISRADFTQANGRLEFRQDTPVDPMKLVNLIQTKPNTYRLEGANVLRITHSTDNIDERFQFIDTLLEHLEPELNSSSPLRVSA